MLRTSPAKPALLQPLLLAVVTLCLSVYLTNVSDRYDASCSCLTDIEQIGASDGDGDGDGDADGDEISTTADSSWTSREVQAIVSLANSLSILKSDTRPHRGREPPSSGQTLCG